MLQRLKLLSDQIRFRCRRKLSMAQLGVKFNRFYNDCGSASWNIFYLCSDLIYLLPSVTITPPVSAQLNLQISVPVLKDCIRWKTRKSNSYKYTQFSALCHEMEYLHPNSHTSAKICHDATRLCLY